MKPRKLCFLVTLTAMVVFACFTAVFSQSIGLNIPLADPSSLLDMTSTSRGLLIPRMTSVQRSLIGGPATGLLVFDTSFNAFYYFNGSVWVPLSSLTVTADNGSGIPSVNNVYLGGSSLIQNTEVGLNNFNMAWSGPGTMTIGNNLPTSGFRLTMTPVNDTYRSGISMTLTNATSSAYGMDISTGLSSVNGIRVTNSSLLETTKFYNIGSVLSSTNIVSGYMSTRIVGGKSYGVYGITGTDTSYLSGNANTWAGFFQGRMVISGESAPTSTLDTDLEVRNTTSGTGNPATINLRQSDSVTVAASPLGKINFGDDYSASAPQAQLMALRGNASSSASDVPADLVFSNVNDGSSILSERMRIRHDGNTGIGIAAPLTRLHVSGGITMADGNQAAGRIMISDANGTGTWQAITGSMVNGWLLTGNAGTVSATNFLGSTDDVALTFRVNNQKAGKVDRDFAKVTLFGYQAGNSLLPSSTSTTALGYKTLYSNTEGWGNSAMGYMAMYTNTTGDFNTAIGRGTLYLLSDNGAFNVAVGYNSSYNSNAIPLYHNTAFGMYSLFSNTTGTFNSALGAQSMMNNISGSYNTACGYKAASLNATGMYNVAIGANALTGNAAGYSNTVIGINAMYLSGNVSNIVAVGDSALLWNESSGNTGIGSKALFYNTTGNNNTATGYRSLYSSTTGSYNTANGGLTLNLNTIGHRNTAIGYAALRDNVNGERNTVIGVDALYFNSSGSYNTAVGYRAGAVGPIVITTGTYNTLIGFEVNVDNANRTNTVLIGGNSNLLPAGDNRVRIGNASMLSIGGQVGWTTISDERVKTDFSEDVPGLAFITQLKPLTYRYNVSASYKVQNIPDTIDWRGKYDIEKMRFSGFKAQEVEKSSQEIGYAFSGIDKPQDAHGLWGLRYDEFVVPLVRAVQEQQLMIEDLSQTMRMLEEENRKLKVQMDEYDH